MKITRRELRQLIREVITSGISYTALVLDEASHNMLLQYVPSGWQPYAHHMTLISPRDQKGVRLPGRFLGSSASITVTGIVGDDRVIAAVVDPSDAVLPMIGPTFPHVTIATNPDPEVKGKPFMSNQLNPLDAQPVEPLILTGTIQELMQ